MHWYLINSIVLAVFFVILLVSVVVCLRRMHRQKLRFEEQNSKQNVLINTLQQRLELSDKTAALYQQKVNEHQQKINELQTSQAQVNQTLERVSSFQALVEPKLIEMHNQQEAHANALQLIQSQSQEQKLYGRAKKMIEMGADVEELVAECDIPRAEAELLIRMNSTNT